MACYEGYDTFCCLLRCEQLIGYIDFLPTCYAYCTNSLPILVYSGPLAGLPLKNQGLRREPSTSTSDDSLLHDFMDERPSRIFKFACVLSMTVSLGTYSTISAFSAQQGWIATSEKLLAYFSESDLQEVSRPLEKPEPICYPLPCLSLVLGPSRASGLISVFDMEWSLAETTTRHFTWW